MGLFDFLLTRRQKQDKAAIRIGLESGLFVRCPVCQGVTEFKDPQAFRKATEILVSRKVKEGHPDTALFDRDEAAIHQAIARITKDLPYHCTCESI